MQRKEGSVPITATTRVSTKGAKSIQIRGDDVNFVAVADVAEDKLEEEYQASYCATTQVRWSASR